MYGIGFRISYEVVLVLRPMPVSQLVTYYGNYKRKWLERTLFAKKLSKFRGNL